jgi:hypothetical protein
MSFLERQLDANVITTNLDALVNWAGSRRYGR